jgi:glycosyltransferase involved in cell wall biosynthesis
MPASSSCYTARVAETCVYTLDPAACGGVATKAAEVVRLLAGAGHAPRLVYAATDQVPATTPAGRLRYFLRSRPCWQDALGHRGLAIPAWPVPPWALHALPLLAARGLIRGSRIQVGVSGSSHVALPAAVLGKAFVVWVGTLYREEIEARAAGGDAWARRLLAGAGWRLLCRQERFVYRRAALVLANGQRTAAAIRRDHPVTGDRLRVATAPIDTGRVRPDPDARRGAAAPYLLFAGRVNDPRKNLGLLLQAFAAVRRRRPDLALVLVGEVPDRRLLARVGEHGLDGVVQFAGHQPLDTLVRLYQGALLFVLPSLQEGLGIAVLEAMACGTPVVSTRCGGPEPVIEDGETGRLTPNGDAGALADAVVDLLADPAGLARMRRRCVEVVRDRYSCDVVRPRLVEAFRTVYPECFPA